MRIHSFRATYKIHYKALLKLGVPIIIGQVGIIVLGFADTLMIGHHSTAELGAASFVNNLFSLVIIFSIGFASGLTPVVGAFFGRNELARAGQALRCSLLANTLVAAILTAIMAVVYFNLEHLGQPAELIPLIKPYYLVLLISLIFVLLFNGFKQFTDGITDTTTAMWILIGGNVLNIAGNFVLIYGYCGFPEMGLLGAGISTLFSRVIMVIVFACIFFAQRRFRRYRLGFFRLKATRPLFRRLNVIGWPVALQMGMETAAFSLSAVMVGWLGTVGLASHQIMIIISQLAYLVAYGMGAAVAVRVSYFMGALDIPNVRRSAYAGLHLILSMSAVICFFIFLFRLELGCLFTDSAEVSSLVAALVVPMMFYQLGDGVQITFANALRGISDVKPMVVIAFVAYFLISLPAGYFFGFVVKWGVVGIWWGLPFGLSSAAIMLWLRFRYKTKMLVLNNK